MEYRHGDIPLYKIDKPEGKKLTHNGSFIIALGEATGHHHQITVVDVNDLEVRETKDGYILVLRSEGELTHQEHGTIRIAPGTYKVGREREMDWFGLNVRRVID